jgi:hypothetical protein
VLVVPSPKFQAQNAGVPDDKSVNWTGCPEVGDVGLKLKDAASAAATVTVRLLLFEPVLLVTVRVTDFDPAVV